MMPAAVYRTLVSQQRMRRRRLRVDSRAWFVNLFCASSITLASAMRASCYDVIEGLTRPWEVVLDSDFRIDVSEVNKNIDVADVIALYFPLLRKTLLMDLRTTDVDGPMIKVVPMANTPEERFQSLLKMRPRFGRPDSITIIPWAKYMQSLADLGIWEHIVKRYADTGSPEAVRECGRCFGELLRLERKEIQRAITGENYETIWGERGIREEAPVIGD